MASKNKVKCLLMGRSGSGKTSMRSIIFDNVVARDTRRLGATIDVESSQIRFLGDLQLDLWDCGGQDSYMDSYLGSRQETIFRQVQTLIYIFDITATTTATDMVSFTDILGALRAGSGPPSPASVDSNESQGGPMVHVLIHKMDLVPAEKRISVFEQRANEVRQKCHSAGWDYVQIYSTSIWDETLYSAWSDIVATLNPHAASLSTYLTRFARMCNTSEVVLFEKTTLLVISQSKTKSDGRSTSQITAASEDSPDTEAWPEDRFAKISQAIKLFRVGCKRLKSEFTSMEIKQHSYTAIFDAFTPKTYILVVSTDEQMVDTKLVKMAIDKARPVFANLPGVSLGGRQ